MATRSKKGRFKKGYKPKHGLAGPGRMSNRLKGEIKKSFLSMAMMKDLHRRIKLKKDVKTETTFLFALWDRVHGKPVQPIEQRAVGPLENMSDDMLLEARTRVDMELADRDTNIHKNEIEEIHEIHPTSAPEIEENSNQPLDITDSTTDTDN